MSEVQEASEKLVLQAPAPQSTIRPILQEAPSSDWPRPWFPFRRSSGQAEHTHRGFGYAEKSHAQEPQSTAVSVLGEVSAPHPSNCKHQGPGQPEQPNTDEEDSVEEEEQSGKQDDPLADSEEAASEGSETESDSTVRVPSPTTSPEAPSGHKSSGKSEEPTTKSSQSSPTTSATDRPPSRQASPLNETSGSLGTRALLGKSGKPPKMVSFWGVRSSEAPLLSASEASDGVVKQVPIEVPTSGGLPTKDLPVGEQPTEGLPAVDLPALPAPALSFEVPALPAVVPDLNNGGDKPHAKKRLRNKLKSKAVPKLAKARKLVLKKKILAVLLGKELTGILEPHLNTATSGAGGAVENGPAVPVPTPL
jgi:hypothetical protein